MEIRGTSRGYWPFEGLAVGVGDRKRRRSAGARRARVLVRFRRRGASDRGQGGLSYSNKVFRTQRAAGAVAESAKLP